MKVTEEGKKNKNIKMRMWENKKGKNFKLEILFFS